MIIKEDLFLARNKYLQYSILALIFITAFGIRVYGITKIPLNYHPIKQYRSALTARAFYYSDQDNIEGWQKKTAIASLQDIGLLGPPLIEWITAHLYAILGSEDLWIPKGLSVIYWIIGGFFLYAIAQRMLNKDGALVSTTIYLFLPFGVLSSQSFQPDPLMVAFMIICVYMIILHHERSTTQRLLAAGSLAAIAILIKPVCLFIIFGAYLGLQIHRHGFSLRAINDTDLIIFSCLAFLPSLAYYGYGILNTNALNQQANKSFLPQLLLQPQFWDGWLKRIKLSLGFPVFVGSMLSVFLFPNSWQKRLLFGMWGGYFVMCLVFTYTISTHDYYHLPLFPVVALSFGSAAELLFNALRKQAVQWYFDLGIWLLLGFALFLSAGTVVQASRRIPAYEAEVRIFEEVGNLVSHSTKTIFLSQYDGKPLMYYGRISGQYWPYWYDIRDEKLWGVGDLAPSERLKMLSNKFGPKYFIVTDLDELINQHDLMTYLSETYPVLVENKNYIIYQLSDVK